MMIKEKSKNKPKIKQTFYLLFIKKLNEKLNLYF